jgi:asparagine synthase (glutamine-hydrolysing)
MMRYVKDHVFTNVDRASIVVALEASMRLLEHRVGEYSWRLPRSAPIEGSRGRFQLARVLSCYVPLTLLERPKAGFAIPIGDWIHGSLFEWATNLLSEQSLATRGPLDCAPTQCMYAKNLSGHRDWRYPLRAFLILQTWHKRWAQT